MFFNAGILSVNFASLSILKTLNILNKKVSFKPGNTKDGTKDTRSTNE